MSIEEKELNQPIIQNSSETRQLTCWFQPRSSGDFPIWTADWLECHVWWCLRATCFSPCHFGIPSWKLRHNRGRPTRAGNRRADGFSAPSIRSSLSSICNIQFIRSMYISCVFEHQNFTSLLFINFTPMFVSVVHAEWMNTTNYFRIKCRWIGRECNQKSLIRLYRNKNKTGR